MGKNYYGKQVPTAEHLNNIAQKVLQGELGTVKVMLESFEEVHLGKSSSGWRFLFNGNGQEWKIIQEYKDWTEQYQIYDEYGVGYTHEAFWQMVESKQHHDLVYSEWRYLVEGYEFSTSTKFC